jgi:hypothetical protein
MKKFDFAKLFVAAMSIFFMVCIQENYALAWFEKDQINAEVTISLVGLLGTAFGFWSARSVILKRSRNEHGLDENGVPFNTSESMDGDQK